MPDQPAADQGGAVAPTVTVVIATHQREGFLPDLVAGLQAQSLADFEAVFVDDGSTDGTAAKLQDVAEADGRFSVVSVANGGPARARNHGIRLARAPWIAFTDDDCVPHPGWLAALLATAHDEGADVVQGRTEPDPAVDPVPWFHRSQNIRSWSGRFQTCNLLVRRDLLTQIGGFDESFPHPVGEDTDLGLRLVDAGARTAFSPEGLMLHRILPMTYAGFLRRRWGWAKVVHLVTVNPRGRSVFRHPYIAHGSHAAFWAAVPVTAVAVRLGWWPVPVALVAGYGGYRAYGSRHREHLNVLARFGYGVSEIPGTVVGAVAFLVESVRNRRLLI